MTAEKFGLRFGLRQVCCFPSQCRRSPMVVYDGYLLEADHAEQAVGILGWACGEEQLVGFAAHAAASEGQSPQAVKANDFVARIRKLTHELAGRSVECIDTAIGEVSD